MRIDSIKFNSVSILQKSSQAKKVSDSYVSVPLNDSSTSKIAYNPAFGASPILLPMGLNFKRARTIRCMYCGKEMIPPRVLSCLFDFESTIEMRSTKAFLDYADKNMMSLSENAKNIVKKLEKDHKDYPEDTLKEHLRAIKYQKDPTIESMMYARQTFTQFAIGQIKLYRRILPEVQARALVKVEQAHNANPEKTLKEIMSDLRPKYLHTLESRQNGILEKINLLTEIFSNPQKDRQALAGCHFNEAFMQKMNSTNRVLSNESKAKIDEVIQNAKSRVNIKSEDPFSRKVFIQDLDNLSATLPEKEILDLVREVAVSLPSSTTSLSAFMVKYSGFTKKTSSKSINKRADDLLSKTEKEFLDRIKKQYDKQYKSIGINQLMQVILPNNVAKLTTTRKLLVDSIRNKTATMTDDFVRFVSGISKTARKGLNEQDKNSIAIKQEMLDKVNDLRDKIHSEYVDAIRKKVLSMPVPTNDVNAFIVQYKEFLGSGVDSSSLENMLSRREKEIFSMVKEKYQTGNGASLGKNIDVSYEKIKQELLNKQTNILNDIEEYAHEIPLAFEVKANQNLQTLENVFANESTNFFMQQKILNRFREMKIPVTSHSAGFNGFAARIPTSENNANAFVIKYYDALINKNSANNELRMRTDKEIAESFLKQLVATEEHVKPQVEWGANPEKNRADNLGLAHKGCNEPRAHTKLRIIAESDPSVKNHIQEYLDDVIRNLNEDYIDRGYNQYPEGFSQRIFNESGGLIKLDTSKLKVK